MVTNIAITPSAYPPATHSRSEKEDRAVSLGQEVPPRLVPRPVGLDRSVADRCAAVLSSLGLAGWAGDRSEYDHVQDLKPLNVFLRESVDEVAIA